MSKHPLLQYLEQEERLDTAISKNSQYVYQEGRIDNRSLIQKVYNMRDETRSKDLPSVVKEAMDVTRETLAQLDFPIFPKISYQGTRNIRYATSGNSVISGVVNLNVEFKTLTGANRQASITVAINKGELIPPSIIDYEGKEFVMAQSAVDYMVNRSSSYQLPMLRGMYDPPMDRDEREMAARLRNDVGWQEVRSPGMFGTPGYRRRQSRKALREVPPQYKEVKKLLDKAEKDGEETFPRPYHYLWRKYISQLVGCENKDSWETHLINDGYALNPYGGNRGRKSAVRDRYEEDSDD